MKILLISVLMTICYVPGMLLRVAPFHSIMNQKQKRVLRWAYVAFSLLYILLVVGIMSNRDVDLSALKDSRLIFNTVMVLTNIYLIRGHVREHLFVTGLVMCFNYVLIAASAFTAFGLSILDTRMENYGLAVVMTFLLQVLTYFPIKKLICNTVEPFLTLDMEGSYWKTIWFIPLAMFFSMQLSQSGDAYASDIYTVFNRAMVTIAVLLMCYSIAADHKRFREKMAMAEQIANQKLYYVTLSDRVEEARKNRHDFKHHIAVIQSFIDRDDKEGLRNYCDEMIQRGNIQGTLPYSGNSAADGILARYIQLAEENDILFHYKGRIPSDAVADVDLCVLLGNALDNALEGCLSAKAPREIMVLSRSDGDMLSLMVSNSFDGKILEKDGILLSRKRNGVPGVGLTSMRTICEQYQGSMEYNWDEKSFTVLFVLPNRK